MCSPRRSSEKDTSARSPRWHCEDILQILPYLPSLHGVQIDRLQPDDRGLLLLVEVLQVLQPEIARALGPVVVLTSLQASAPCPRMSASVSAAKAKSAPQDHSIECSAV